MSDRIDRVEDKLEKQIEALNTKVDNLSKVYERLNVNFEYVQKFIEKFDDKKFKVFMQIFRWGGAVLALTATWIFGHKFSK